MIDAAVSSLRTSRAELRFVLTATLLSSAYVTLTVFAQPLGWILFAAACAFNLLLIHRDAQRYIWLLIIGLFILIVTPINTETTPVHLLTMTTGLFAAVLVPYGLSHLVFKSSIIHFNLEFARRWTRQQIAVFSFVVTGTVLFLYLYFSGSNAHAAWPMETTRDIAIVFGSIMVIGLWEEFFFIATVFGVFQRYMPFIWANILQAIMFCSFLYLFGFQGWIVPFTFIYALCQGTVFHIYKNLLINATIHVIVDLAVFVFLLMSARPDLFAVSTV